MKRWIPLALLLTVPLAIYAFAQGSPVQWQAMTTAINNIQSQLNTLTIKVAALSAHPAGITGQPGQLLGFAANQQGESENVVGDCQFTRTATNTYQIVCTKFNGTALTFPLSPTLGGLGASLLPLGGMIPVGNGGAFPFGFTYQPKALSGAGDCSATLNSNGVLTLVCTKTNGTPFGPPATGSASGNTTTFATTTGSLLSGNLAAFDVFGNVKDSGTAPTTAQLPTMIWNTGAIVNAGTTLTLSTQTTVIGTDVEFAVIGYQNAGTITPPVGWTNVAGATACSGNNCVRVDYHVVAGGEPGTYVWTSSISGQMRGGMLDVRNANQATPVDTSSSIATAATSATLAALAPSQIGELALLGIAVGANNVIKPPLPQQFASLWPCNCVGSWGAGASTFALYDTTGRAVTTTYATTGNSTFALGEVLIKPLAGPVAALATLAAQSGPKTLIGAAGSGGNTITGYSVNNVINVQAYGTDPTGAHDSSGDIQSAINAACAAATTGSMLSVFIPAGNYLLLTPIVLACDTAHSVELFGAGKSATALTMKNNNVTQSYGVAAVGVPANQISSLNGGTITATSLATGVGKALYWASSAAGFTLDLSQLMRQIALKPLNGLSALDVRMFAKLGALAGDNGGVMLAASDGLLTQAPGAGSAQCNAQASFGNLWGCGGAYAVGVDSNGALRFRVNISGTMVEVHSANAAFTISTTHEIEAVMDGSNACLFLDGTRVATTAQAGTITQRVDEDEILGATAQTFPMAGEINRIWNDGPASIDSFEIRKAIPAGRTCGNASYTQDTTKFTGDGNSLLLLNFDNLLNIKGATTTSSPLLIGADYFNGIDMTPGDGPAGQGAWLVVTNEGLTSGAALYVHDLAITNAGIGLFASDTQGAQFDNLTLNGGYTGLFFTHTSFNGEISNLDSTQAGLAALILTQSTGLQTVSNVNIGTVACGWACMILTGGATGVFNHIYVSPASTTVWDTAINNFGGGLANYQFNQLDDDVENGGSAGAVFMSGTGTFNCDSCGLTSAGTTPLITVAQTGSANTVVSGNIKGSNLAVDPAAAAVVNVVAGGNGSLPVGTWNFSNDNMGTSTGAPPGSVPWSSQANYVQVNGGPAALLGNEAVNYTCEFGGGAQLCTATETANNNVITLNRPVPNVSPVIRVCEDGTGTRTPTVSAGVGVSAIKWIGGIAPTWTTTASKCDQCSFNYDGTNLYQAGPCAFSE